MAASWTLRKDSLSPCDSRNQRAISDFSFSSFSLLNCCFFPLCQLSFPLTKKTFFSLYILNVPREFFIISLISLNFSSVFFTVSSILFSFLFNAFFISFANLSFSFSRSLYFSFHSFIPYSTAERLSSIS